MKTRTAAFSLLLPAVAVGCALVLLGRPTDVSLGTADAAPSAGTSMQFFPLEGTLESGVMCGCVFLRTGSERYELQGDLQGFTCGDRVAVWGTVCFDCVSVCMEGVPMFIVDEIVGLPPPSTPSPTSTPTASATPSPTATPTPSPDGDGDTIPDSSDNCPLVHNPDQQDSDGDMMGEACDPCPNDADCDDDGCSDRDEVDMQFDPTKWFDFFDVPVPTNQDMTPNGVKNQAINLGDVLAVLFYVGTAENHGMNANGVDYDSVKGSCDVNGDTVADEEGLCFDRTAGPELNPPWDAGPPDGAISISDVLTAVAQVGLNCGGPP